MSLVTVQRSPSPSDNAESEDGVDGGVDADMSGAKSPCRQKRSKSALQRLKKLFNTVRFISKLKPCFSESFFAVKGAALILPQSDGTDHTQGNRGRRNSSLLTGEIQTHLQSMFYLLRREDTIKVAVKLESLFPNHNRYMAVVSCMGRLDTEESVILGIDCNESATIGLVLPVWADTSVSLNGDGGFVIRSNGKQHIFRPVSVQAMWSALLSLNKIVKNARDHNYVPPGLTHTWVEYYTSKIQSERSCITEWYTTEAIDVLKTSKPIVLSQNEEEMSDALKSCITTELRSLMMKVDLEEVTSLFLRQELEKTLGMNLKIYRSFIDEEMINICGQMDSPSKILDYLYLGTEWNASNLEELVNLGISYILNITNEVDNFFPEMLQYMNIREWDVEGTNLKKYWESTHRYISNVRKNNAKVLVHCRMGISRSSSTVMAYLMKEYQMTRQEAYDHVKSRRPCVNPNPGFWKQLEIYEGILRASRHRSIFKSKSEQNLLKCSLIEEELEMEASKLFQKDDLFLSVHKHTDDADNESMMEGIMFDPENSSRSADSTEESQDIPSPKTEADKFTISCHTYGAYHFDKLDIPGVTVTDTSSDDPKLSLPPTLQQDEWNSQNVCSSTPKAKSSGQLMKSDDALMSPNVEVGETQEGQVTDMPEVQVTETGQVIVLIGGHDSQSESSTDAVEAAVASEHSEAKQKVERESTCSEENIRRQQDDFLKQESDCDINTDRTTSCMAVDKENPENVLYSKDSLPQNVPNELSAMNKAADTEGADDMQGKKPSNGETGSEVNVSEDQSEALEGDCEGGVNEMSREDNTSESKPEYVYLEEDVMLPSGIVRKTRQEIEERHRFSGEIDLSSSPVQRASSLKEKGSTTATTLKSVERRKTCTPIIHSSKEGPDRLTSKEDSEEERDSQVEATVATTGSEADGSTDDGSQELRTLTSEEPVLYRHGCYQISVEKGIVKKQKMDIELRNEERRQSDSQRIRSSSDSEKEKPSADHAKDVPHSQTYASVVGPAHKHGQQENIVAPAHKHGQQENFVGPAHKHGQQENFVAPAAGDGGGETKDNNNTSSMSGVNNNISDTRRAKDGGHMVHPTEKTRSEDVETFPERSESDSTDKGIHRPPSVKTIVQDLCSPQKSDFTRAAIFDKFSERALEEERKAESQGGRDLHSRSKHFSRRSPHKGDEAKLDETMLELIREIGSAFLNSPVKTQTDEEKEEKEAVEEGSLVKFLVRNIEKRTATPKKKHLQEVIIIDKDSQQREKRKWRHSCDSTDSQTSDHWHTLGHVTHSSSMPQFPVSHEHKEHVGVDSAVTFKIGEDFGHQNARLATQSVSVIDSIPEVSEVDTEKSDKPVVRALVGKFEHLDTPHDSTSTPTEHRDVASKFGVENVLPSCASESVIASKHSEKCSLLERSSSAIFTQPSAPTSLKLQDSATKGSYESNKELHSPEKRTYSPLAEADDSILSEDSAKLRDLRQNLRKVARPKSADTRYPQRSNGRNKLTHSNTLPESEDIDPIGVSMEGRKVRKLHGKNHPLTKLESRRRSPFYSTM